MSETVEKALKLLELVSTYNAPVRMAELSRVANMNKSTAFRMLEVMSQMGYVTQDEPNGRYIMTTKMWEIGVRAFQRNDLRLLSQPYLRELVDTLSETAILTRRDRTDVIIVEKIDCAQNLQALAPLGSRSPVHASSFGKAYLMVESPDRIRDLASSFERFTDRTMTEPEALLADLEKARKVGAASGSDEYQEGISGVAAPVFGADGKTHGAIGVSVPTMRMTKQSVPRFIEAVSSVARRFSESNGYRYAD